MNSSGNTWSLGLRRYAILFHRWLGVIFCALFVVWFVSGIVMMYWSYPKITAESRLSNLAPLDAASIRISPGQAFAAIQAQHAPEQAKLTMLDGRPVYRFSFGSRQALVYADDAQSIERVGQKTAIRVASAWTGQAPGAAHFEGAVTTDDQWTVNPSIRQLGPFWKYSWPDGQETYVSQITGEVAQNTTRGARIAAYFGAIPHWIYFTSLRQRDSAWRAVVIWSSGIGVFLTILGLVVGVWLYSPSKRYRFRGSPLEVSFEPLRAVSETRGRLKHSNWRNLIWPKGRSSIPYAGQKRWHTVLGLFFGLVTCTWSLSGMFSMNPLRWSPSGTGVPVAAALRGTEWRPEPFEDFAPSNAVRDAEKTLNVKELELTFFLGEPVYLASELPGRSVLLHKRSGVAAELDQHRALEALRGAARPYRVAETRMVEEYESYYVDRHHEKPLPVLFVRFADPAGSMHYIDLHTGRVVESYVTRSRWNRWLYHGLHSIDLPLLYRYRPAWDILVLLLMFGGTALSVTSVIIGWRRLRRKLRTT